MKKITPSSWAAYIGMAALVIGNVWTLSSELTSIKIRLDGLEDKVDNILFELKAVDHRNDKAEIRIDKLEYQMKAVEKKLWP